MKGKCISHLYIFFGNNELDISMEWSNEGTHTDILYYKSGGWATYYIYLGMEYTWSFQEMGVERAINKLWIRFLMETTSNKYAYSPTNYIWSIWSNIYRGGWFKYKDLGHGFVFFLYLCYGTYRTDSSIVLIMNIRSKLIRFFQYWDFIFVVDGNLICKDFLIEICSAFCPIYEIKLF